MLPREVKNLSCRTQISLISGFRGGTRCSLGFKFRSLARGPVHPAAELIELAGKRVLEKVELAQGGAKDVDEILAGESSFPDSGVFFHGPPTGLDERHHFSSVPLISLNERPGKLMLDVDVR